MMDIKKLSERMKGAHEMLAAKGYVNVYDVFSIDLIDGTFRMYVSFKDEYDNDTEIAAERAIGETKTKWNLPIDDMDMLVDDMFNRVVAVPYWDKIKTERALAQLTKAVNRVAECDETMLTVEQINALATIREEMDRLAGNALTAPIEGEAVAQDVVGLEAPDTTEGVD